MNANDVRGPEQNRQAARIGREYFDAK
jgi:hypothetical protein